MNGHKPENGQNGQWWKTALAAVSTVIAGGLIAGSGMKARLDDHAERIQMLQVEQRHMNTQLDRMEEKIDRLKK